MTNHFKKENKGIQNQSDFTEIGMFLCLDGYLGLKIQCEHSDPFDKDERKFFFPVLQKINFCKHM